VYSAFVSQHFIALIRRGATAEIAELVERDPSVARSRDAQGVSALLWSVYSGQALVTRFLLSGLDSIDIFEAAATGDIARLEELLDADPSLIQAFSPDGWTALHLAAAFGGPQSVAFLLGHGADPDVISQSAMRNRPLHAALSLSDNPEAIRHLIAHGADLNAKQAGGYTALHQGASAGKTEAVKVLMNAGADPTVRCDAGKTPADYAEAKGHHSLANLLRETQVKL